MLAKQHESDCCLSKASSVAQVEPYNWLANGNPTRKDKAEIFESFPYGMNPHQEIQVLINSYRISILSIGRGEEYREVKPNLKKIIYLFTS